MHQMTLNFIKINSYVKKIANPLNFNVKLNNFKENPKPRTPEVKNVIVTSFPAHFSVKKAKELKIR